MEKEYNYLPKMKKNYTITSEEDFKNINNGRCPDYAVGWSTKINKLYWPDGHNYFKGDNNLIESPKNISEIRKFLGDKFDNNCLNEYKVSEIDIMYKKNERKLNNK